MNGGGFDFGSLTPEEREYLLKMLPNLTGMEDEAQHQQALANALRLEPTRRMDWGSQAARAITVIGSGLAAQQAQKTRAELGEKYRAFGTGYPRRKRPNEMAETPYSYGDIWGQS